MLIHMIRIVTGLSSHVATPRLKELCASCKMQPLDVLSVTHQRAKDSEGPRVIASLSSQAKAYCRCMRSNEVFKALSHM